MLQAFPGGIGMFRRTLTITAFLAGFAPLDQAAAASSGNEFLAHVVGHIYPRGESFVCFTRQYDAAHLAAHPVSRSFSRRLSSTLISGSRRCPAETPAICIR